MAKISVNKSYQYSSITSVTILDCWTIAWVIILMWLFLGTRYSQWKFFGAAVCLGGLGLVLLPDAKASNGSGGSKPILGDILVIIGTFFFSMTNVGELLKNEQTSWTMSSWTLLDRLKYSFGLPLVQLSLKLFASTFPTVVTYVVDTPLSESPTTFMSNMLYACSILYKTRLPLVLEFNKTDVANHEFALEALITTEMGTMFPENAGYVVWVSSALGPYWSFHQVWMKWLSGVIDNALYPVLFLDYLKSAIPALGGGLPRVSSFSPYHVSYLHELQRFNYRGMGCCFAWYTINYAFCDYWDHFYSQIKAFKMVSDRCTKC